MKAFRYQAIEANGASVNGEIEAEDRKAALRMLGARGLFPSVLENCSQTKEAAVRPVLTPQQHVGTASAGGRVSGKDITAFTREMGALLGAAIPIPQALDGLGQEEENPALRAIVLKIADSVRKGAAFSAALEEHPKLFSKLYVSMVRVGEEAGVLPKVMADLAELLEHEDELRGEVLTAVAYPVFVLCFGFVTVTVLLTVVMPKLFSMLTEMATTLPLPTIILLRGQWIRSQLLDPAGGGSGWGGRRAALVFTNSPGRGEMGRRQVEVAGNGRSISGSRLEPVCADAGHAGQKRRFASASLENRGADHWQSGVGKVDCASGRGDARRRFVGRALAQTGHFSQDRGAIDQCGRGVGHAARNALESG